MSYDPSGLGLGIGFGGFGEGFTASGYQTIETSTMHSNRFADAASRRKLQSEVIAFLAQNRGPRTFQEIAQSNIGVDLRTEECKRVMEDMAKHTKLSFDPPLASFNSSAAASAGSAPAPLSLPAQIAAFLASPSPTIAYRPTFPDVRNSSDLYRKLLGFHLGLPEESLADAYIGADKDIEDFVVKGEIYRVYFDEKEKKKDEERIRIMIEENQRLSSVGAEIPKDSITGFTRGKCRLFGRFRQYEVQLDQDVKKLWSNVKMPSTEADIEDELYREGHMSERQRKLAQIDLARRATEELKRRKESKSTAELLKRSKKRFRHITNTHLMNEVDFLKDIGAPPAKK